jgi:hypothetical protein
MRDVLQAPGRHQAGGLLEASLDGQHLKGSARGGVGDKAIALVLAYLRRWGLLRPRPGFPGGGPDGPGCPANRGHHFLHRKDNRAELKDGAARRTMPATTRYLAARCGFGGFVPPEPALAFPGLQQLVEIHRHQAHQRSGGVREETHQPQPCPGERCQPGGRRAIENRLHHKRDTVLGEGLSHPQSAQALAALRDLLLGSHTSAPPLCFAVLVASPPIPGPAIAGSVGVYDKSLNVVRHWIPQSISCPGLKHYRTLRLPWSGWSLPAKGPISLVDFRYG